MAICSRSAGLVALNRLQGAFARDLLRSIHYVRPRLSILLTAEEIGVPHDPPQRPVDALTPRECAQCLDKLLDYRWVCWGTVDLLRRILFDLVELDLIRSELESQGPWALLRG